ncbi:MAG: Bax inhibitor-1/YccA family protein [Miltoncostaeaceae bacterium]
MAENTPETGWYDQATAAGQAQAVELEKVTQKILFSRVMFLVGVTCAFTALGAFVGRDLSSGIGIIFWVVALGMILASGFIKRQSGALGMGLLFAVGLVLGFAVGPTLNYYVAANGAQVLWQAAGATALFISGFGAWGYATRRDLAPYVRFFFWALIGLIGFGIVMIFVQIPGGQLIWAILGLVIFAFWTAFDFQRLKRSTTGNVAVPIALGIFLDIFNVFLFFLQIFGGGGTSR